MIESFNIQVLIDIIFAIVVVASCYTTLSQGSRGSDKKAAKWRDELIDLQAALRELIENASIASNNLDRRLLKRKEELETLLEKIEVQQSLYKTEEVPNATWTLNKDSKTNKEIELTAESCQKQSQEFPIDHNEELDRLINFSKSINNEIEKVDEPVLEIGAQNFANQIDPATYKIAKRLIAEGHEINVIARKLEMPLAQVRLLDRIIRNGSCNRNHERSDQRVKYGYDFNTRQVINGDY